MRGDDNQTDAVDGSGLQERRGPRHAAPRKSLLTKLHMPAGKKAFALAAMPTAVFVGMGLTPKLAMADDSADIPYAPGPCVTRSDEPSESPSPSASATKSPSPSATASGRATPDKSDGATPKPSATPSASASGDAAAEKPDDAATGTAKKAAETPSATPSPTKSKNPLDPLGLGDALKDLFDGPDKETPDPSPSATTASPKPSASSTDEKSSDKASGKAADKPADKPVKKVTDAAKDTADKTADAIREAAGKAGKPVKELDEDVKGLDPKKDEDIPDGAKPSFPCPTADPKALADADLEQGIPRLPNDPWVLESSLLTLSGLDYKGIVEVQKGDGSTKKVLKFTASSIDIKDLHQLTVGPQPGVTGHVKSRPGSTSTIRDGTVTMYTEELKGNLFGLIPITFSPETPPPINVPFAFFTKVKVTQAGQFGGTLSVPGLQNFFTKGTG
uniref:Hydrogenase expression protein HypF n=1 Tax=Streptomyces sp. NBC_00008 TaxID=2903610 RepID=A0AAU2VMY3_9ACTN